MAIDYQTMMVVSTGLCMLALATSCWKHDRGLDVVASEGQGVAKEEKVKLLRSESYDKEFKRLVAGSNMTVNATEVDVNRLCNDIDKTVDVEDAVQLFDLLGRMALSQPLVSDDYTRRQNHLLKLWYVTLNAFVFAQNHRQESFKDWDRLFAFFKRYTDEIAKTESGGVTLDKVGRLRGTDRSAYVLGLKGDLARAIHVMRRFFYPRISGKLTDAQKEDILRRFDEVENVAKIPTS